MNKRVETPLIGALEDYRDSRKIKMHMPGHKGGQGFPQWFGENLAQYDFTEIPGLDNLHNPKKQFRQMCKSFWSSKVLLSCKRLHLRHTCHAYFRF